MTPKSPYLAMGRLFLKSKIQHSGTPYYFEPSRPNYRPVQVIDSQVPSRFDLKYRVVDTFQLPSLPPENLDGVIILYIS